MKKVIGWILLIIFVGGVCFLVYLFLTKGYSGINKISPTPVPSETTPSTSNIQTDDSGTVNSNKVPLIVTSPKNGATLSSTNVTVAGKTLPGVEVFVNDQEGKSDTLGNFSITIGLEEGKNDIVVNVNDDQGNAAERDLTVTISTFE